MPKYKPLYSLYKGLRESKYDVPDSYVSFQKTLTQPGNAGAKSRRGLYQSLKDSNYDVPDTYEDFYKNLFVPVNSTTSRALKIGENPNTPTVNRYRQKMFDSVDPNKNGLNALSHRAVGQAVRATNNVRKPVTAKVVNQKGKPTGEEFAITPAKTVEDLDREYAQAVSKNWENELHDQMDDADRDAAKISDMFKSFIGSTDEVGSVWGNMTRGGGIAGTPHSVTTNNGIMENTEARQILAAGDYNRKRRELLQLEQDSRNGAIFDNHSFFRGMYDAAKDTGFLTGGASDLINAGSLLATKQDLDNGIHTEAGDMLMQQAVKNSNAQSQYGDNQGWMYTGGVITTNMAPFMVQIGSAGFSKGMSTSIGKVVQGAASKVALGTMEKATGIAGAHIANYIGKVTGLTTKAFGKAIQYGIVGAAQANTVGLGNVANDVINRYTGQVYQDEQGNYKFGTFDSDGKLVHEGGEDFLTALVKGETAQTIEFATELAGGGIDAVGTALKNFVKKGGKEIIKKYNMKNVSKVIDFLLNNKVSKNARYLKAGADRTLGKVEVNSIVGESLEEELGIIANTVFTGDNKISDLWDEKQQSQIWGGMLLSIGLMKGAVAPFHAYNAKQYYSYKHKLDKADVNLSQLLGKEKWEELRNQIDATTNDDMPEMVNKINRDVALGKNRQPVREYIQNLLIMRGYDIGNMLAAKKAVEDKGEGVSVKNMEKNQAYQQGRDAYGYDTHEIQLDQEDKQKSLAQLLGISEQQLASMSDEELEALSGRDDNIDRAIYDYQLSTARYEGVIDNARDQIDLEVQRAAQAVDMYTDKSRNTIRNATIKATGGLEDYGVYIINGNIATHEDGSIDISNSDDMILYYDPTTNTVEHADAMMFAELGSEENADEVRSQAMADAKEKAIKETTGIIDGVVEVGTQFKTVDADGTEHTYEVLADNGDGTAMITIDGNIPTELVKGENVNVPVSFEELQKMKDESDQQRLQAAKAQREQMEKERAEQQMQAQTTQAENPAQEDNIQSAPIEDNLDYSDIIRKDGKVQMVDVSDKDGNNLFPDAKDVFYIQGNKMRTKFAYIDANGELKTQSFPTGLVKIKTRGEVSVDDYKKYRNMILSAESSAMPESSMIEDNSGEESDEDSQLANLGLPKGSEIWMSGDGFGRPKENTLSKVVGIDEQGSIILEDKDGKKWSASFDYINNHRELPPLDENTNIVNEENNQSESNAEENTPAPEQTPAMTLEDGTIVPMLEDGNPDFSKLTAAQTAELYDTQFGDDADSIVSGYVSDAKKALDKASNMTVKGKTFVEQKAAKDAKEKAIADAQAAYDSAIAIRDAYNERQLAKVEDTAEGRKELIEKARRKFARLKSAVKDDTEAVSQLYRDTIGSLLHRLYDGTGIDVTDTIPLTAEEYVTSNLGAHSLNYEGTETSKGVKQETGLSREDFAKTQLLAADGKGTTIDALVHSLWENRPSNLESLDTQEIRNALLSVITSGFKASEARNYIENLRIAQAENILEEQKKAADNAAFAEEQKAKQEEEEEKKAEEKIHSEAFNNIVDLAKKLEEILDNPDNVKEIDKITHEIDELLETLSDEEFKEVSDVLLNIDEDLEYLTADEYERREGVEESKKAKAYNESLQQAIKRIAPYADALKAAVKSGDKKAIAKAQKELTDALLASNLGHGYLSGQLEYAKSAKKKDESYSERRALVKPLNDAINAIESALDSALAEAGLEGVHVDFTEGGHGWIYADKGSAWSSRLKALDNDYRNVSQYETQNPISVLSQVTMDNVEKVAGIIKSRIEEGERYNSDEYNDEENEKINEQTNENINAPEQNKFPDKLREGSKAIEVPEDATDENPLGLQLSEDKVPFEIEGGKSGETYNINDNEDRQRLINDNKVDDKDILDIDMPKHVHKAIKELCKKMGLKVQFLYMGARSNGWIENGTMYLALDTEKATQFVFGHEMTHAIKQKNPEAYKELVKVAMAVTTRKKFEEDLAKVYQNYYGISGYNNIDDYVEEVVADNLGKFINDFDLAQKFSLRLNHPVLATILHAIQKIKSLLYGDFYKSVDALERIVEKAYVDTANGQVTNSETGEDVSFSLRLKSAIEETETNPSDAQKESGNYKKGHIKFGGYDYTIENPKGSTRSGKDADGKEWKVTMHDTYGYIRGKFGKDGDHLDMFINDKADLDNWNGDVFVVDQVNPDGSFDEHKVMYGYDSMDDAKKAYLANYSKGWQGLGNITGASKDEFDKWLDTSNRKLKPFADYAKVKFSLKDIKPVGVGAFGNIYNQFRGNAKAAIEFLKKVRGGEAVGALHHKDIGDIDLVWGKEGTGHSDGYGLSKLVKYHPEVLDNLQEILNDMRVVSSSKNRVNLESETHKAGVRLTWDGERKSWLLTAFKKETSASDKRTDTAATSLEGDTALSQTEGSAAKIDNSSETAKGNDEKFSLKDEKTLAGVHNISEEKLLKAIKQGGLANPSVAVIDSSRQDHKAYGGISLILPSDKIAKRTGKNAGTWQGDAYTPTYPEVEKQMSNKGAEKSSSDVLSVPKEMQHEVRNGIDRWLNGGDANSGLKYLFLHEKGVAPEPKKIQPKFSDEAYNELKLITAGYFNIYGIGKADAQKVLDMYIEAKFDGDKDLYEEKTKAWLERNKSIVDAGAKGGMRYAIAKENVELYDEYGFNYKGVQTFVRDVEYDHRKSGVDTNATLNEVEDYIKTNNLTDEFNTWLEGKEKEYGIKEVIFDGFTPSGNRRYVPNTLENVSKLMKKQGRNGATGAAVSFQNFAARLMPSYGTLKDIRSKKGLLTSDREKFDKFREKWSNIFFELGMKCQPDATGTFDDYGLARLSEAAMTSDPQAYLKKEYNVDFSDEDTKRLKEMVKAIKEEHPAMYFETKFERPVRFDEFSAAVVPTTTKKEVKEALKNAGVSIFEYDEKSDADRKRAFNEAINSSDNIRFSLAGERGAADMAEDLKSLNTPDEVDDAIKTAIDDMPSGWKMANKKMIHIAQALGENRKAEIAGEEPKFSLKDGTLIKAGTYFSGGGLVEEGLKGIIDPVVAVEYDEKISGVYRNNFGQHIVTADVRDVDPKELVKQIDGEVEYFHASPVCKNYSQAKSNHAEVELDKETAASTAEFINAIKPKVVTIENVKGYKDSEAMKTITDALDANGYTWDADVYNAADYGGYTNRERLIIRAVRDGKLPEKPKKMAHKSGWYEAVADIIPTLTEKKNGVAPWMDIRLKADGIDWRHIDKPLYVMGSAYADEKVPHAFADELLPTLRTKSGDVIVMPDGKVYRAMGRVLARVSGVSDDYKMPFSENLSHTIIGNGIPTQLTEHVIAPLLTGSDPKFSIRTYHGTGASFDKFDFSHMGEGEGSQAFGWGGYVTNSKDIAEDYTRRAKIRKDNGGFEFVTDMSANNKDMVRQYIYKHKDVNKGLDAMRKDLSSALEMFPDDDDLKELSNILAKKNEEIAVPDNIAYLYDVDIPDDNGDYLDWDAPLTDKQKNTIIKELRRLKIDFADFKKRGFSFDGSFGGNAYDFLMYALRKTKKWKDVNASRAVSKFLSSIGFTGIKYKAGTIFGGAKEDDYNYVIFDENNANIVGNTRFSLRGSTPYDKQMEEWMEKNNLEKGAVPMEKPIMKEGENIFDYANRMVEWTRNQNLWKTAPKQTGFQDALDKWKADNGLSPDAYPPVRPHREYYSSEIGYAEDLEEYNKKKELWKSAPKPKDFDLSVDLEDMNKQLRNIRRAVLNQKNYDQRTVKAVSDLVRKMLNIGWGDGLSRGKVGNLLSAAKNATGANDVKKYLDKAMGILAENYLNRLSTAYDNLINTKGARADQSGVIKMGSLDAKGQAFMSEYKKAINMDDKSLNNYIANIEEDSAKNEDNVEMNDYRLAGIQAAIMYKQQIGGNDADIAELKKQIGELKNKKDATKEDKDLLKSLEKKLFENKFDRITMYENLLNNIQRMVKESKGRAKEFREEITEHKNEILHRANLDLEGVDSTYYDTTTAKKKLVNNDLQRAVFSSTYTFEQFLKFFGKKAANGEGYLYNYFTKLNQDALDEEQLYNEMNRNALDEKTKELFGKEKFMKLVGIDGKGMKEMDVEVTDYSNKETGKRTIHLKQGQMLYIYLVNKETDGEMKLRAMGITEEDVAAIEENLDPRVKAMGEWLQDEYLPECQRRYQATHTKYFGAPMKDVENYFPLAINNRARNVKEDVNQDSDAMSQLAGTSTGAIVTRRVNVIPLDIENADAFEVAFNHLQEMEEWSAMLPFRQDINTMLSYTHFRNQVQNMSSVAYGSGKTLWDEFKQTAQIAAGTYKPKVNAGMMDSRIAAAMGGIAVAKISGRLWTAIKQSQSATVFLPESDFTRFVKNGVNPYGSWKWAKENIPDFRKRIENITYGDVKLRQYLDELEKYHDWTKVISKWGMAPNILVDGITCAVGARSVYETEVNRLTKLGYPKEKAEEKAYYKAVAAYNKTQQSSGGMYLSPMQVDRTYVSAALSLFKNANYAYGRMQIEACRGLARTYDFWGGKHKTTLIESMTRQIMEEDGLDENTARAIAKATYNRTFRQSIGRLINFATLVPVSWALYKVLPYLLTGDDDDKKKDMIEEAVLKGFATSLSDNYVIPFASNILNAGLKVEDGKPTFDPEVFRYQNLYINPATSDLANIYSMVGNQKWYSVANKLGMLGVQSLIGFNPETVGALYQALSEADYDNGNTAKEWQIGILKAISAPEESIRELYMDELGLKSGDIKKIPLAELEKRYAERQINRDNLLSQIGMDAETFNGYVDKYQKSFEKKIKDKMDKWDEYDKKKADEFFDTTSDHKLKDMIEKKRTKDANAAADEQIAKEGLNQEKKGKEPSEEAYDAVKMSIDVAEDNAISTYNKVLYKRYAALNDEYNNQTDAMKYIFMNKHPNFKAYKDLESEYTTYGKKMKELKEKLVSADGYDAKQTILKQIRAEREKFSELQSKVR